MNAADETERARRPSGGLQVSLAGLIVLVLAAGVAAGVARGARETWGVRLIPSRTSAGAPAMIRSPVPIERTIGLVLEMLAIFMIVLLGREFAGAIRRRRELGAGVRRAHALALLWRGAAIALLAWFVAYEWSVLRYNFANEEAIGARFSGWREAYRLKQGLFPVCALMAMLGLALGMGAGAILGESPREARRPYWLFVPLAGLAGLLVVAQPMGTSVIPYLVLIAIEAVTNALQHRLMARPGLSNRLLHAGMDASAALAVCLVMALCVAHDFERARRKEPWATGAPGRWLRGLLLCATAASGICIATVTMPAIHPAFAEGFWQVLGRAEVFMIMAGFGVLATGLAARTVMDRPSRDKPRGLTVMLKSARFGAVALVMLSLLAAFPPSTQLAPSLPGSLTRAIEEVQKAISGLFNRLPDPLVATLFQWLGIETMLWYLMILGLAALMLELAARRDEAAHSPLDALAESKSRALASLWLVAGFVVMCLAVLPALIVAGQVLIHLRINSEDLMKFGVLR
jgi:hypothetical protein